MEVSFTGQALGTRCGQSIKDTASVASHQKSPTTHMSTTTSFWHSSGIQPQTALSHPGGTHWAAKHNVSFERRCSDERSQVNCLGYNRNLPVRPSHFPWQLGLTSPTRYSWMSCEVDTEPWHEDQIPPVICEPSIEWVGHNRLVPVCGQPLNIWQQIKLSDWCVNAVNTESHWQSSVWHTCKIKKTLLKCT